MTERNPATPLRHAIVADAARAGVVLTIVDAASRDWASATFVGHRHRIVAQVTGDATAWLAGLPEAEWHLAGHLVAGLAAERMTGGRLTILVLTLHDHRPDDSALI